MRTKRRNRSSGHPGHRWQCDTFRERSTRCKIRRRRWLLHWFKNSNLYGPKTETLWGSGSSTKGSAGDKGDKGDKSTAGSQFLSVANNPTTIGSVGDFYFNTSSGMLFGSKTSSGWGNGISLRCPKGDKGDPGNANVISSGWVKLDATKRYVSGGYRSPNDIGAYPYTTNSQFPLSDNDLNGVVLVYVRNLSGYWSFDGWHVIICKRPNTQKWSKCWRRTSVCSFWWSTFCKIRSTQYRFTRCSWNETYMENTYFSSL